MRLLLHLTGLGQLLACAEAARLAAGHRQGDTFPTKIACRRPGTGSVGGPTSASAKELDMIILGVVLLIIGFIAHISILWTIGLILVIVGAVFAILGATGRAIGGRKHWY
jgi:hypothetical protein